MIEQARNRNGSAFSPVDQDGRDYLVNAPDLAHFFQHVGSRVLFQIEFTADYEKREFVRGPYLGYIHYYKAGERSLDFKYDGDDPEFFEHRLCQLTDIRGVLLPLNWRTANWQSGDTAFI